MNRYLLVLMVSLPALFLSCGKTSQTDLKQPVDYVDPMIGTGFHGHTYPGAVVPFGRVQLSPDTRLEGWDAMTKGLADSIPDKLLEAAVTSASWQPEWHEKHKGKRSLNVMLNGRELEGLQFKHSDIKAGGTLEFYMTSHPVN